MSKLEQREPTERFERVNSSELLTPGKYWRVKTPIENDASEVGDLRMVSRLRIADDVIHSVEVYPHPARLGYRATTEFLLSDFFEHFEYAEDGAKERECEVEAVQARIDDLQKRMVAMGDPATAREAVSTYLLEQSGTDETSGGLPALSGDVSRVAPVGTAVAEVVDDIDAQLEGAKAMARQANALKEVIGAQGKELSEHVDLLGEYYQERAKATLAGSQDVLDRVDRIQNGLQTLDAFLGKGVEIEAIRNGAPAPVGTKIKVFQRLLYADEECAINALDGGIGVEDHGKFLDALERDDALLDRMVPAARGLVAVQHRRNATHPDYLKGREGFEAAFLAEANRQCFLLYRDGERVTTIYLPTNMLSRLFPSEDEQSRVFQGYDALSITVDDLRYVDCKDANEALERHYKRILVSIWGMHTRGEVFTGLHGGEPLDLNGLGQALEYIHDDEAGTGLGVGRPSWPDFIKDKRSRMAVGSLVVGLWDKRDYAESKHESPCPIISHRYGYVLTSPTQAAVLSGSPGDLVAKLDADGPRGAFKASYSMAKADYWRLSPLVLDEVTADDLRYYIDSRAEREHYIEMLPVVRSAYEYLVEQKDNEADAIDALKSALVETDVCDAAAAQSVAFKAVRKWRIANKWSPAPSPTDKGWSAAKKTMLDLAWSLAGDNDALIAEALRVCRDAGEDPLQLTLSGNNVITLHTKVPNQDERLGIAPFVYARKMVRLKTKIRVEAAKQTTLPQNAPDCTVLKRWDACDAYLGLRAPFGLSESTQVEGLFAGMASNREHLLKWFDSGIDDSTFDRLIEQVTSETRRLSEGRGHIQPPLYKIPVGFGAVLAHNGWGGGAESVRWGANPRAPFALCLVANGWELITLLADLDAEGAEDSERYQRILSGLRKSWFADGRGYLNRRLRKVRNSASVVDFGMYEVDSFEQVGALLLAETTDGGDYKMIRAPHYRVTDDGRFAVQTGNGIHRKNDLVLTPEGIKAFDSANRTRWYEHNVEAEFASGRRGRLPLMTLAPAHAAEDDVTRCVARLNEAVMTYSDATDDELSAIHSESERFAAIVCDPPIKLVETAKDAK